MPEHDCEFTIRCDKCGSESYMVISGLELHAFKCETCENEFVLPGARRRGHVYFITGSSDDAPIKIGFTRGGVVDRMKSLQTGSHDPLRIVGAIPAEQEVETELHKLFSSARRHGEWFERTSELLALVKAMQAIRGDRCPAVQPIDAVSLQQKERGND